MPREQAHPDQRDQQHAGQQQKHRGIHRPLQVVVHCGKPDEAEKSQCRVANEDLRRQEHGEHHEKLLDDVSVLAMFARHDG